MTPAALMLQGTGSDVGKSLLVTGLARAYTRRGLVVRPFKPQNMSNNAAVTAEGGEIGRAQALQARACGVAPSVHMNPVLLKPQTDVGAQVVVRGKVWGNASARDYAALKAELLPVVLDSFARLAEGADLVLVEGAGSPAEVNLREGDIANMGFAEAADVPVVLVGDIERGGVIASVVGTWTLLSESERARLAGLIINRFRGDPRLFDDGLAAIARRTGLACFGVVPYFAEARRLPAEDALALETYRNPEECLPTLTLPRVATELTHLRRDESCPLPEGEGGAKRRVRALRFLEAPRRAENQIPLTLPSLTRWAPPSPGGRGEIAPRHAGSSGCVNPTARAGGRGGGDVGSNRPIRIAVPVVSRIANFDDLDPLIAEPDLAVTFVRPGGALPGDADLVILPGSKATLADLAALRAQGWDVDLAAHLRRGGWVLGLCGGYQMLGRVVRDPRGLEGRPGEAAGLGLLDVETELAPDKRLTEIRGLDLATGQTVHGYEMHMGTTRGPGTGRPMLHLGERPEGAVSPDGKVMGCYLHGLFAADGFRHAFLSRLRARRGSGLAYEAELETVLERLADHLEAHLDLDRLLAAARRRHSLGAAGERQVPAR